MNTVKWRGLRMVAVAVAGFVLLAAILAVSPDASEAGRSGSDTTLTATAGNGIVAVNDGGHWAGVSGLVLPFP